MRFDDLKLRTKSLLPLCVLALTLIAIVGFAVARFQALSASSEDIAAHRDVAALKLSQATAVISKLPYAVAAALVADSSSPLSLAAQKDFDSAPSVADSLLQSAMEAAPAHAADIGKFRERVKAFVAHARKPYRMALETPGLDQGHALTAEALDAKAAGAKLMEGFDEEARKLIKDIGDYDTKLKFESAAALDDQRDDAFASTWILIGVSVVSASVALSLAVWISLMKIERPLRLLSARMGKLAEGDLDSAIKGLRRRDEIGDMARAVEVFKANAEARRQAEAQAEASRRQREAERLGVAEERAKAQTATQEAMAALREGLKNLSDGVLSFRIERPLSPEYADVRDDFNSAADKLKAAMALVVRSTGAIHASSREIGEASNNLSQRTEQQAASLEETAAALGEITNTLRASAENARAAADAVAAADADARQGAVVVRQAVEAMDAIAQSSQKIGQIIGAIDEIAFQTNLLALNAGVEAARAGDSGRGFAVVASEVRALAQRSAEAAKEIKALVSTSGAQVTSGVKLVAASGKALESIIAQVSEINAVVASIAAATQQQASGIAEINTAISHMDQTTQQNATMVEESTAASHSLSKEMSELTRLVEQFRIDAPGAADLRRSLQAAAPHAFARPAAPPRSKTPAGPKLAAAGGEWTEF